MVWLILLTITLAIIVLMISLYNQVSPYNYNSYRGLAQQRTPPNELRKLQEDLDAEGAEFVAQVKGRGPGVWTLGESAWYESIRRREALYS
jgi:hypothetical protein